MLELECAAAGVQVRVKTRAQEVQHDSGFVVRTDTAEFHAPALVVATGGLSIPRLAPRLLATNWRSSSGSKIRECRPALVPLTFNAEDRRRIATWLAFDRNHRHDGRRQFREKMLITHRG